MGSCTCRAWINKVILDIHINVIVHHHHHHHHHDTNSETSRMAFFQENIVHFEGDFILKLPETDL